MSIPGKSSGNYRYRDDQVSGANTQLRHVSRFEEQSYFDDKALDRVRYHLVVRVYSHQAFEKRKQVFNCIRLSSHQNHLTALACNVT